MNPIVNARIAGLASSLAAKASALILVAGAAALAGPVALAAPGGDSSGPAATSVLATEATNHWG